MTTRALKIGNGCSGGELDRGKNELCLACGLCCQGYLHSKAALGDMERSRAKMLNMEISEKKGKFFFVLPCPHHRRNFCTIYEERFNVCRRYKCALLEKWSCGEVSWDSALETIETLRARFQQIKSKSPVPLPSLTIKSLSDVVRQIKEDPESPGIREEHREFLLDYTILKLSIDRFFYPPSKGS
ncbi:MAG TPA: YkgJ family cysteine cluster protein [Syntrophales bacterium]|nr:YkgJ family cysteine cluster protein [Syntrophales bacterium]